tara:strand:+ start:4687 stop:5049 length:363 start_codon:yes stop_codon:yes gene_type:complete
MNRILHNTALTGIFVLLTTIGLAQSEAIQPDFLNIHITQATSRMELTQIQSDMGDYNIGFRYDMVTWSNDQLQSIRFAVRLPDGTMRRTVFEAIDAETDIWIRLEGSGTERIFCAGSQCE